jgi:hypothetical protein
MNPNSDKSDDEIVGWEKVTERRAGYLVEYMPARPKYFLATLNVTLMQEFSLEEIASIVEFEFEHWATKFNVPLMASAWDRSDHQINLQPVKPSNHIIGYYNPASMKLHKSWSGMTNDEFPEDIKSTLHLLKAYQSLPHRTVAQKRHSLNQYLLGVRLLKGIFALTMLSSWVLVPLMICYLQELYIWLSAIIIISQTSWGFTRWLKSQGYVAATKLEVEKAEKRRKMEHYFYHCEKNPQKFEQLKAENFEAHFRAENDKTYRT